MKRMEFDPADFSDNGSFGENSGWIGFLIGLAVCIIVYAISYFYFANTGIQIINRGLNIYIIAIIITIIEASIFYFIRNRKKKLTDYSEDMFDSKDGLCLLIAGLICSFYLNCILLCEINGRLDFSESKKIKTKIIGKRIEVGVKKMNSPRYYYFDLENWKEKNSYCKLEISESIYTKFSSNNMIEFETKPGLLGLEHLSSEITLSK